MFKVGDEIICICGCEARDIIVDITNEIVTTKKYGRGMFKLDGIRKFSKLEKAML